MAIEVIPYAAEWVAGVEAFNQRMQTGGSRWGWYGSPVDEWLPKSDGRKTWREHWLAVEDRETVRGAFALKPHEWHVHGSAHCVTDWQGPVTEGSIDRRFSALGLRLIREMLKQHPRLYSWGHGGQEQPMLLMLDKLGWLLHPTPFCVRVLHPVRFLRQNRLLRSTPARRLALDVAAFSGAGSLGIRLLHASRAARAHSVARAELEPFEEFGPWADDLWERSMPLYEAIALRDARTMNALVTPGRWPPVFKLRALRDGVAIGWALVLDTQMHEEQRFGSLRVGSLVDCLAAPSDAASVVGAALRFLRARGVDIVISNQAHPAWIDALAAHGFLLVKNRRVFAASPALRKVLEPWPESSRGLHLTNMDGHGPMGL